MSGMLEGVRHLGKAVKWEQNEGHSVLTVFVDTSDRIVRTIRLFNQRVEVPILNFMYGQEAITGTHRINFMRYDEVRERWVRYNPSAGDFGTVLLMEMKYFRQQGIILVGKVKSPKDIMYKWVGADKNSFPLWNEFLEKGKLFKEYQRCLGNELIVGTAKQYRCLFVDLDKYCADNGIILKDAGDGGAYMKEGIRVIIGKTNIDVYHSVGYRILDHPKIRTAKGNITTNIPMFKGLCAMYGVNPDTIDLVIPLVTIKVLKGQIDGGTVKVIDKRYMRFISYRDAQLQHKSRITVVGASTLAQYATVVVELLKRHSKVVDDAKTICDAMRGDLGAYVKMVGAGSGESVMAEVSAIAFPIFINGEGWKMPLLEDYIHYLFDRCASYIQKHIRKAKLRDGWNMRASFSLSIEQANKDNHTGAYIIKRLHQAVIVPQRVMVDRTLGDYDGDDVTGVEIAKGVHLCWRNPLNGPNSMFVGIEKGKASVQDVPEWAMPIVRAHKKLPIIAEPPKGDSVEAVGLTACVNDYQNQLLNAWANAPLLGQATNQLFKNRILQMVNREMISHDQLAQDNADIEFKVVKAIKTNLDTVDALDAMDLGKRFNGLNLTDTDSKVYSVLGVIAKKINKHNTQKLEDVFPVEKMTDHADAVWDCCSKFSSSGNPLAVRQYLTTLIEATKRVSCLDGSYVDTIPIIYATSSFLDMNVKDMVSVNWDHYVEMAKVCRYIFDHKDRYGLPTDRPSLTQISRVVRDVELMSTISSAKVPRGKLKRDVLEHMTNLVRSAISHIVNNNVTGQERLDLMAKHGRILLYSCLGMYNDRGDYTSGVRTLVAAYAAGPKSRGRDLCCGLSNIDDQDLRSFAFGAVSVYMKQYIKVMLQEPLHRFMAMIYAGQRLFVVKPGLRPRSPRLWNIMYGALPFDSKDVKTLHLVSGIWCNAVQDKSGIKASSESVVNSLDSLFGAALNNQAVIDDGKFSTDDFVEMYDADEYDTFS